MFWLNALAAVACGALLSAAVPALGVWPLALALPVFFYFVAQSERSRDAFGLGFFFGLSFFTLHVLWLPTSFTQLFGTVSWAIFPPLLLILGTFWGIVTYLARLLGGQGRGTLLLLPALWVLMEWARTQGYFAFPWGTFGYIWLGTPLAQLADISGVYGLSLFTTVLASLLAAPFLEEPRRHQGFGRSSSGGTLRWPPLLAAVVLVGLGFGYGQYRLRDEPPIATEQALLVQGNTDPLGRATGTGGDLSVYLHLTRTTLQDSVNVPSLVIWPEGAVDDWRMELFEGSNIRAQIEESASGATVVTGGSVFNFNNGTRHNSVYSLRQGRVYDRYDKVALVPFGERWPLLQTLEPVYTTVFGWFGLGMMVGTEPGDGVTPLETPLGLVGSYICYESVFPQIARTMAANGAQLLVNISNDAWFGVGMGAQQHFQMGIMRAIETRRYLLRVGNDGVTALIDPLGQVRSELPRGTQGTLLVNYALSNVTTPYVRFGDWLIVVLAIYGLGLAALLTLTRNN